MNIDTTFKGQFLIAMPYMGGGGFAKTVTYVCEHDDEGAMGLVINRPTGIALDEIFSQLDIEVSCEGKALMPIYAGGPVQTDRGFILHQNTNLWESTVTVVDDIALTTSKDILASIAKNEGPEDCLVALGCAGWGPGQLEQEMSNNYWLTAPATKEVLFHVPHDKKLEAAASTLGISLEQLSPNAGHA